jgi:hypothetical protein
LSIFELIDVLGKPALLGKPATNTDAIEILGEGNLSYFQIPSCFDQVQYDNNKSLVKTNSPETLVHSFVNSLGLCQHQHHIMRFAREISTEA